MHLILFFVFAGFCLAGAINLLVQSHPIASALSLIVVMTSLAVLYLMLGAEFLAAAQVIVYAHAKQPRGVGGGIPGGGHHSGRDCHSDSAFAENGCGEAERRHHIHR
jgi:hypothetical protein